MNTVALSGTVRNTDGTKAAAQLRREERVPCVLYGGQEVIHFSLEERAIHKVVHTPDFQGVEIDIDGRKLKALVQETQFHPISDRLLHVDFLLVDDSKPAKAVLSVRLTGQSTGVRKGGKLSQTKRKLTVKGLPADLPSHLDIDVSDLDIGQSLRVSDLKFKGLTFLEPGTDVVVGVKAPKKEKEAAGADAKKEAKK